MASSRILTVDPATGRRIRSYPTLGPRALKGALARSRAAFGTWREHPPRVRARLVLAAAERLRGDSEELARLATLEMGKPLSEARAEVAKCALACAHYGRFGPGFLAGEHPPGAPENARVVYEPLGPLLAIMPWNFPYWQVFRAAAPALVAGNTVLLKHAPNVTGCALAIESLLLRAGIPAGVFQTLVTGVEQVPALIADPAVAAVTLTGSVAAGKAVAARAGAAMKKGVFELGGSDPYIVLKDADLDLAAEACATSRLINAGQSCIAAKRFIVVGSVAEPFERKLVERMLRRKVGDPSDPATQVGPLARADLREGLHRQVTRSVARGARVLLGGSPLPGPGFYYAPTVLTAVSTGMPAYDQELFGPVAAVIRASDEAHAVRLANDSAFGLGAAVFTRSPAAARRLCHQLEAGSVFVNDFVRSDPALPFGGIKQSGYGRELGPHGMREFVNAKTVVVS